MNSVRIFTSLQLQWSVASEMSEKKIDLHGLKLARYYVSEERMQASLNCGLSYSLESMNPG